jgi:protein TonB
MVHRRKRNSSKVNLTISVVFHSLLVLAVVFFAAREGMLGKKLKQITVTMVPKEKKPEPPKEKPPEPKPEPSKPEVPKPVLAAAPTRPEPAAAPPPQSADPSVAPPPVDLPAFSFPDGAREIREVSDPQAFYKGLVELALHSRWQRPENLDDEQFFAEVDLAIDANGRIGNYEWLRGSGNKRWDDSVKAALAKTKTISRAPPKGFPNKVLVRFDVDLTRTEPVLLP